MENNQKIEANMLVLLLERCNICLNFQVIYEQNRQILTFFFFVVVVVF